jgi:hypothetical protein
MPDESACGERRREGICNRRVSHGPGFHLRFDLAFASASQESFRPGDHCVSPLYAEVTLNLEAVGPLEPANAEAEERKTNEFRAAGSKYLGVHFAGMACRFLVICD